MKMMVSDTFMVIWLTFNIVSLFATLYFDNKRSQDQ